jgi:RHS repeat-associated protein
MITATPIKPPSTLDYDPFGMLLVGRNWEVGSGYRYGFNNKENDDEIAGNNNALDFGARIYDSRLGRFLTLDFFSNESPNQSPYSFAINSPIYMVDFEGNKNMVYIYLNESDVKLSQADKDYLLWAIYVAYSKTLTVNNMALALEFVYVDKVIESEFLDKTDAMLVVSDPDALLKQFPNGGYRIGSGYPQGITPRQNEGPSAVYPSTYRTPSGAYWLDVMAYNAWHEIVHYLGRNFTRNFYAGDDSYDPAEAGHDIGGIDGAPNNSLMTQGGDDVRATAIQFDGGMAKTSIGYLFKISNEGIGDLQNDYGNKDRSPVFPKDNASTKAGAKIIGKVKFDSTRPKNQPNGPTNN